MGKVVTSGGLNEFIETGKHLEIKADPKPKPQKDAPPLEVKKEIAPTDVKDAPKKEDADEEYKDPDPETQAFLERDEKARKAVGKKHKEAMSFKALAEKRAAELSDAEEFAKGQWNEKRLSDERAAQLERELAEFRKGATKEAPKVKEGKPDPKVFVDDKGQFKSFEYAEALATWAASNAVEEDRAKQAEEKKQAEAVAAEAIARARVLETEKKHPDFKQVMDAADVRTHTQVINYLSGSEFIGEVSYYLGKNPDFLARINAMHPLKAIAEIGKLEATFEKPPAAKEESKANGASAVSGAPPPIKTLSSATTVNTNTDPAKMTYKELRAYERSRRRS